MKKYREQEQSFLIEGEKMVLEALAICPDLVKEVYLLKNVNISIDFENTFEINNTESEQISGFKTPNKCLALLSYPRIEPKTEDFTLVLDQIQDPGNLGTIIRLADWFGLKEIVCSSETADCFNPKVIQASMGSIFRVKVNYTNIEDYLKKEVRPVYGALLNGENVYQSKLPSKGVLVMGNEGNGLSESVQKLVSHKITIPKFGKAESLNVSSATSILLSEFFRNR
jgi:TrmH family RNA methyltransferase